MGKKFEFEVREKALGDGTHGWEARDKATGTSIALACGGNGDKVGSYPELEEYLSLQHGVETSLTFIPSIDEMSYRPGGATWTYRRNSGGLVIIVEDIHRTVFRFTLEWER